MAYALADAVNKGSESQPTYLLLDLGVIVHEGMSLVLMPMAAPLFRREALMCELPTIPCLHWMSGVQDIPCEPCAKAVITSATCAVLTKMCINRLCDSRTFHARCSFGPPIFFTAGSIAAYHYWRANPGGLKPDAIRESTMKVTHVHVQTSNHGLAAGLSGASEVSYLYNKCGWVELPYQKVSTALSSRAFICVSA